MIEWQRHRQRVMHNKGVNDRLRQGALQLTIESQLSCVLCIVLVRRAVPSVASGTLNRTLAPAVVVARIKILVESRKAVVSSE